MTSVNYAEVVSHFIHAGMPAGEVDAMLHPLSMLIVEADQAFATIAGRLRAVTAEAGLSLRDRFCLALVLRDGLTALKQSEEHTYELQSLISRSYADVCLQ